MTTATVPPSEKKLDFDPDEFRMTIGEHLEELRKRLIYGLLGFAVALIGCMAFGERVVTVFCAPLYRGLQKHRINPQLYTKTLTEGFMTYLQISIVCGIVIAGPWMLYQLWLFIAAGLYPKERQTITRYIPLSMTLLISGVLFVYFLVLPLTIDFFLTFTSGIEAPKGVPNIVIENPSLPMRVPVLHGDPANPPDGAVWFNEIKNELLIRVEGHNRLMMFGPENLLNIQITLDDYVGLVLTFMLVFALSFQLPLVLLALVTIGIVEIDFLRKQRKLVWFIMAIVAAIIAPGDVVTSMLALLIPLVLLYEFGIWLAEHQQKRRLKHEAQAEANGD